MVKKPRIRKVGRLWQVMGRDQNGRQFELHFLTWSAAIRVANSYAKKPGGDDGGVRR